MGVDALETTVVDCLHPGLTCALLELSEELEVGSPPSSDADSAMTEMGHSTALLESLRGERPRARASRAGAFSPGQRLGGYRLIERLGQGSQADVWKAVRVEPGPRVVAVKLLSPEASLDPLRREQFRREAELGARLSSPALLPTIDRGEVNGVMYLVMPMVNGCTLREAIAQRRRQRDEGLPGVPWWLGLSEGPYTRMVVRVLVRICRTLQYLHVHRVAHRDIKPANIMLDREHPERVFLCDLGLGCDLDVPHGSAANAGAGTPLYMAPEKLGGGVAGEVACDLYALGVTLFEALTLVHPFLIPDNIPRACLAAYLATLTPPRPSTLRPSLPEPLDSLVLRLMDRDPARRHHSAAELADDLEAFLTPQPVSRRIYQDSKTIRIDPGGPLVA